MLLKMLKALKVKLLPVVKPSPLLKRSVEAADAMDGMLLKFSAKFLFRSEEELY